MSQTMRLVRLPARPAETVGRYPNLAPATDAEVWYPKLKGTPEHPYPAIHDPEPMAEILQGCEADTVAELVGEIDLAARTLNPLLSGHSGEVPVSPATMMALRNAGALLRSARTLLAEVQPDRG
jgi:hypothetical protein